MGLSMKIKENVSLAKHSTMRLGGNARFLSEVTSRKDVVEAVSWANQYKLPIVMIGSGSNIVWTDNGFEGLVLVNNIRRFETFKEDKGNTYITVGSGEIWDDVVKRTTKKGLSGIEALSLIPGTAGATPVQNIGAYGQEIKDTLVSVEAYDRQSNTFVIIPNVDCKFGYRTSRFKTNDKDRFFITAVTLHLNKTALKPPFYESLQTYLTKHRIKKFSPKVIRKAVVAIRSSKLPNPAKVANNGSFFANPIITNAKLKSLQKTYPNIVFWDLKNGYAKLSAAWLIERAGFKDFHDPETGMGTWPLQPLVLVNEHAETTRNLIEFRQKIVIKVRYMFGIVLEQEPELLGKL